MVQLRNITLSDVTKAVVEAALGATLAVGEVVGEGAVEGVAEILVSAILTHAEAVAGNDGLAKSVVRAARCAGEVLTSLREADFPEKSFSAYFEVLETLAKIRVCVGKWTGMSWCKKAFSVSVHTRQSNAIKYKKEFEAMNALLCVYLGQLSDAETEVVIGRHGRPDQLKESRSEPGGGERGGERRWRLWRRRAALFGPGHHVSQFEYPPQLSRRHLLKIHSSSLASGRV